MYEAGVCVVHPHHHQQRLGGRDHAADRVRGQLPHRAVDRRPQRHAPLVLAQILARLPRRLLGFGEIPEHGLFVFGLGLLRGRHRQIVKLLHELPRGPHPGELATELNILGLAPDPQMLFQRWQPDTNRIPGRAAVAHCPTWVGVYASREGLELHRVADPSNSRWMITGIIQRPQ
jgi:hypothetical protein